MREREPETSVMRGDIRKIVLAVVGGLAAVLFLAMIADPGRDAVGGVVPVPFGWIIPLASAAVIAGLAWFLLSQTPRSAGGEGRYHAVACGSCGRAVLTDWRLCPYCGSALGASATKPDAPSHG